MAVLEIVKWPAPVLDTPADPVTEFDADLEKLVSNMFETMYAAPGVGLAAVQVGVPKRLFVGGLLRRKGSATARGADQPGSPAR
jgi:peptide deformylase